MAKNRWILVAVLVILLAALIYWWTRRGAEEMVVDLVTQFDTAEKRSNMSLQQAFAITDATINGETKHAIFAHPTSRIIWKVTVPENAWLRTALGVSPDVWNLEGDGVLFRIGVSDGRNYEELLNQLVNPIGSTGDRRWVPVVIDLSAYGGQQIELIFNTNTSLPGKDDPRNDHGLWGAPEIFVR